MMRRWVILICWGFIVGVLPVVADEDVLEVTDSTIITQLDAYGTEQQLATGWLANNSNDAYNNITLLAEAYDSDDTLIGEGFGFVVNACGEALLDNFVLEPGAHAQFEIPLELFESEAAINQMEIIASGQPADFTSPQAADFSHIIQVTDAEVVALEWVDDTTLYYSPDCWRDVFTNRDWVEYDLTTETQTALEAHPRAAEIRPVTLQLTELTDPLIYNRSFFQLAPGQRRGIYQGELNTLNTVEPDGSFRRILADNLYNISLQGINWHKNSGMLLAYYHAGYGDEVLYIVANADGQTFSQHPTISEPSQIVPGFAPTGREVVIFDTRDDISGYYLRSTVGENTRLLFEAVAPGNNWPAPFYDITADSQRHIYIVRPVEGQARLQCYNASTDQLHDYTAVPLNLASSDRAWTWLSPESAMLAIGANGIHGGLWLVDLTAFPACD